MPSRSNSGIAAAFMLALAACNGGTAQDQASPARTEQPKPTLGLFTTLPLYWGEAGDIATMLDGETATDWVRAELETRFEIVPLNTLEADALDGLDRVLLAQPRPLAPSENVSFDGFLARGGKAVILADPMLTRHSEYPIGDPRRPQDVVLLSPIFSRLGVELRFDENQPRSERAVRGENAVFPVNLAGEFASVETGEPSRRCAVSAEGLVAHCVNGKGEAALYADAALLDWEGEEPVPESRKRALWNLLRPLREPGRN